MRTDNNPHSLNKLDLSKDIKVSLFKGGIKNLNPYKSILLCEVADIVRSEQQKTLQEEINAAPDETKKQELKKKLPYITAYGIFPFRANNKIKIHNAHILALDWDKMEPEQVAALLAILVKHPSCILCFTSARKRGVKAIFLLQPEIPLATHFETLKASKENLLEAIGANEYSKYLDLSQFKLSQAFFLSYDPNVYFNPQAEPLEVELMEPAAPEQPTKEPRQWDDSITENQKVRIIAYINNGVAILCNEYETETGPRHPTIAKVMYFAGLCKQYNFPDEGDIYERLENSIVAMYGGETEAKASNAYKSMRDAWAAAVPIVNDTIEEILSSDFDEEMTENPFPIEVFPDLFRNYAVDLKNSLNFPIDYTATAMLVAVATAIGAKVNLKVVEGWIEYASLYVVEIGPAGANKTHPINKTFEPIKAIDKERHERFKKDYSLYKDFEKLSKVDKEGQQVFCPKLEKSILTDCTPEILNKRLEENPQGCTVVSDEFMTFSVGKNNYSKGDQTGKFLSYYNNQPTTTDRVGDPIPIFIAKPYLSIIGGLQPRALNKAFPPNMIDNGFYQRFLFAYPDETLKKPLSDTESDLKLSRAYEYFIEDCFDLITPKTLEFTPEAKQYFKDWQANNCDEVNQNQNTIKAEILNKFDNHFLRLAILLQMMQDKQSLVVDITAVKGSDVLCGYFKKCTFKVLAKLQSPDSYREGLTNDKQSLFLALDNEFTTSEAVKIGEGLNIKERTTKNYLNDVQLYKKLKHGKYAKMQNANNA